MNSTLRTEYENPAQELRHNGDRLVHLIPTDVSEGDDRHSAGASGWGTESYVQGGTFSERQYAEAQQARGSVLEAMQDPATTGALVTREITRLLGRMAVALTHNGTPLEPLDGDGEETRNTPLAWVPKGADAPRFSNRDVVLADRIEATTTEITERLQAAGFKASSFRPKQGDPLRPNKDLVTGEV